MKAAVDVDDLPRCRGRGPRAGSRSGPATMLGSSMSQPSGAVLPERGELLEAGNAARGDCAERAGADEVHADALGPEVVREVARDRLERRLGDAHPVVDRPGDRGVEVEADDVAPDGISGASAAAIALSEKALV